jgi:hypothetical protein
VKVSASTRARDEAHPGGTASLATWARRAAALLAGLFLFVGALQLMKTGAAALGIVQPGSILVENAASTLGLGWLGAMVMLSGSPMAATSLTLVAAGEESGSGLSEIEGFTMVMGSRLGAAFVVLLVAVLYALRAGEGHRRAPVATAVLALTATAVVYVPATALGAALLSWDPFASLELGFPSAFVDLIDLAYGGLTERAEELPSAVVFLAGLAILLLAFKLIDLALPELDDAAVARRPAWLRRTWPMFALGAGIGLVTMSVSVSLSLLVPLVARNLVRREFIVPYIMGANLTTLGDTLLAAFALDSPAAVRVLLAALLAATAVSLVVLAFLYRAVWTWLWGAQTAVTASRARLGLFTGGILLVPLLAIAGAAFVG